MSSAPPSRLLFGSCSSQTYKNPPIWDAIANRNGTAFIWAGDAVYGDERFRFPNGRRVQGQPEHMRSLYKRMKEDNVGYKKLLETGINIFGTVDDHDYGTNDGDRTFPWKKENAIEYINFLDLPENNSIAMTKRVTSGLGVYGVQVYDFNKKELSDRLLSDEEAGLDPDVNPTWEPNQNSNNNDKDNRLVAVFVLDVRTNKTPWPQRRQQQGQEEDEEVGDFLGEEQWKWFEEALRRSNAAVNIIVSGLQVHAKRAHDGTVVENWSPFPIAQHRMYQTILQSNVQAPILISGDVHHAQLLRKDCRTVSSLVQKTHDSRSQDNKVRPLVEITTSGLTHSWGSTSSGIAAFHFGEEMFFHESDNENDTTTPTTNGNKNSNMKIANFLQKYFIQYFAYYTGIVSRPLMDLGHIIFPWNEIMIDTVDEDDDDENKNDGNEVDNGQQQQKKSTKKTNKKKQKMQYTLQRNFAELEMDWEHQSVSIRILGVDEELLLYQTWSIKELTELSSTTSSSSTTTNHKSSMLTDNDYHQWIQKNQQYGLFMNNNNNNDEWVCVHYRGIPNEIMYTVGTFINTTIFLSLLSLPFLLCFCCFPMFVYYFGFKKTCRKKKTENNNNSNVKKTQ